MKHKTCCSCGKRLALDKFYRNRWMKDGYQGKCKKCQSDYYYTHKEQRREYQRRYEMGRGKGNGNRFKVSHVEYKRPSFEDGEFSNNYIQKLHGDKLVRAIEIKLAG